MHHRHKIIISGTGRAGTTFLVRLLTALDLPTGYNQRSWKDDYFPHCSAGLERKITDASSPYIVKDPELCVTLGDVLRDHDLVIDHAIIPIRDLESATLSRARIGGAHGEIPGGLVGTDTAAAQKTVLATRFHQIVHTLVSHDIPHTFLLFPRFVRDADYAFARLHPIFPQIDRTRFLAAFREIADPSLVHDFAAGQTVASDAAARFQSTTLARRRSRRLRRFAGWSALTAGFLVALAFRAPPATRRAHELPPAAAMTKGEQRPTAGAPGEFRESTLGEPASLYLRLSRPVQGQPVATAALPGWASPHPANHDGVSR
ncbi:MAG TPA: hypothetical protein VHE61_06285 [Opitutaceae bacterium]|nr:hypothetical protein [Opitutaceae bacterium]